MKHHKTDVKSYCKTIQFLKFRTFDLRLSTSLAATNDAWAKVEAFRILKKYNKKQRGQALSELLDVAIESMSESDQEQFNEVYEKTIRRKVESLDRPQG